MAKHFPPSDGAMARGWVQGALGAAQRQQMVAASTATLPVVPLPGCRSRSGSGVLPGQPSAMVSSQCCSQEASRETSLSEADGIWVGVLGFPAQLCAPSLGRAETSKAPEHPLSTFPWGQQCWHLHLEISFHRSLTIHCTAAAFAAHVFSSKAYPPSANVDQTVAGERHQNKCKQEEKLQRSVSHSAAL